MVALGIGKNMVRSSRFWVEATGMAQATSSGDLEPSWLGRAIFNIKGHDPYLEDNQTLWLLHWNLSTNTTNPLFAWDFLINRWQDSDLTESAVLKTLSREVERHTKRLSPITLQQHFQVFLHSYVPTRGRKAEIAEDNLDCPLTELELLVKMGERDTAGSRTGREAVYVFRREEKPSISAPLFAYCLSDYWEKMFPHEQTIPVRSVATGIYSPGQVFKIPEEDIYARLPDLASVTGGVLSYQESTTLPQVHRNGDVKRQNLLAQAYH